MKKKTIVYLVILTTVLMMSACKTKESVDVTPASVETSKASAEATPASVEPSNTSVEVTPALAETFEMPVEATPEPTTLTQTGENKAVDVDLTNMSSTMVYSEVYNILISPEDYLGKIIKMKGAFCVYEDPTSGNIYFSCLISDATACCQQGIEFVLAGDYQYPNDYPEIGSIVTVAGEFETYYEGELLYCRLKDATLSET